MTPDRPSRDAEEVVRQSRRVRRLARALVFDPGTAADVEQEALLAALERPPRDGGAIGAWLKVTVRNLAHRAWRSRERREARERAAARPEGSVPDPAEILAREEQRHLLVTELLALGEPWRSALVLRYLEELPPRVVARRLGVPLDTARTRIARGRELLRERLERRDRELGRAHGAWGVALVNGLRLAPDLGRVARHLVRPALTAVPGGLSMSLAKLGGAAALVTALAVVWTLTQESRDVSTPSQGEPVAAALAEAAPVAPVAAPAHSGRRTHIDDLPPSPELPQPEAQAITGPTTGALTLHARWSDGTPAPNVSALVTAYTGSGTWEEEIPVLTDANGESLVQIPACWAVVYWSRGEADTAVVTAGEESEVVHTLEPGMLVTGLVIDRLERPVPGAALFLSTNGPVADAQVVGFTDEKGRFEIRDCSSGLGWLSARAAGHSPSEQITLIGGEGAEADVVLQVHPGGALDGVVLDELGQPVAGAWLQVGPGTSTQRFPSEDGLQRYLPVGERVRTAEDGTFHVEAVTPGECPVVARTPGYAAWSGSVSVPEGGTATLTVQLSAGTAVEGIVVDASGTPVEGAEVRAGGQAGGHGFTALRQLTSAEGRFAFRDLPVGEFPVRVESESSGRCEATLVGMPGATLTWNPVLGGLELRGRIVGLSAPDGCRVEAFSWTPEHQSMGNARVDASGAFVVRGLIDADHQVRILAPQQLVFPVLLQEGVRPGPEEQTFAVDPAQLPSVHLRGRVLDAQGQPAAGVAVSPLLAGFPNAPVVNTAADGTYSIGPVPPGRWRISARPPGRGELHTDPVELGPGTTWDFGDL